MLNHEDYQKINELKTTNPEVYNLIRKIADYSLTSASHACHDLRNHAALISSYCQLLSMTNPSIAQDAYFQKISLSTRNLLSLFDEIAKFRYSFKNDEQSRINLLSLMNTAMENVRSHFPDFAINFAFSHDFSAEDSFITCHVPHMTEAFEGLLTNSVEACNPENIRLSLSISRLDNMFQITLCDNGCGFSEKMLSEGCLPFTSEKKNHSGLGLAIASTVIHKHNGSLTITNTDAGSKVLILLPS